MFYFLGYVLIGLGFGGFLLSSYIYNKKRAKKKLICPMRANCDTVIHSQYSRVLWIPVEILGMLYYVAISLAYMFVSVPGVWSVSIGGVLVGASVCSVLFSIYLVSLQVFVIKHWCSWCLGSALLSLLIMIVSYIHFFLY